jgi:SAM-dependent methyltransferase
MRLSTRYRFIKFLETTSQGGNALEVDPLSLTMSARGYFVKFGWHYDCLTLTPSECLPNPIIGDVTNLKGIISDNQYGAVFCSDVFEHINKPWLAAEEIKRILKPGGYALIFTVFAWRYHPCPEDYFRFSKPGLCSLFSGMEEIDSGYCLADRRKDIRGFSTTKKDAPPIDELGGFRENWGVYFIGKK